MTPKYPNRWLVLVHPTTDEIWNFDVDFLLSNYNCIFGKGCPGGWGSDRPGCCEDGAYFMDDEELQRIGKQVQKLTPDDADHHTEIQRKWFVRLSDDTIRTRRYKGNCIFLNTKREDAGELGGCSLHSAALARGEKPMDWKPDICWQVPIRVYQDGNDEMVLTASDRTDGGWGTKDNDDPDKTWWCVEESTAYTGKVRAYQSLKEELIRILGEPLYRELARMLEATQPKLDFGVPVQLREKIVYADE